MYNSKEKKVPQSLEECYAPNHITENLYKWADRLKRWGYILFIILIVIGVIASGFSAFSAIAVIPYGGQVVWVSFLSFFTAIINWSLYVFIEYLLYNALALLMSALASIVENSKISADVALYKASKDEGYLEENTSTNFESSQNIQ